VTDSSKPDKPTVESLQREIERLRAELYDHQRAQESLRDTEQRLRAVVEHAPIVVFAVDRDGIFTLSEGRGLESLGLKPGQVVGMSAFEIYQDFPQIKDNLREALAGTPVNDVVTVGHLVFESIYIPRRDDSGTVVAVSGVAWDVTTRVQAEHAAAQLEFQLMQAQKMETIGTLAGGIAHDFNNILSPILGYTDIAIHTLGAGHEVVDDLEQVMRAARRAKELVEQILIFSRRGDEVRRPMHLHVIVLETLKLMRASLPTTIEIVPDVITDTDGVYADPGQMHQAVMNLCTNAAHAMRETGGKLRVSLTRETLAEEASFSAGKLPPGGYVVLSVRDAGEGMEKATLERIFDPFFTTKPSGEGTGLGLSVVHGIVMSHGGAIDVESGKGQGTTMRIYLPAIEVPMHAMDDAVALKITGRGEHVLVVDDEPEIARMLSRILEAHGYRVSAFTSSEQAMEAFRRHPGEFAAVITDQTMPHRTGTELAHDMHALVPTVPVLLTTGVSGMIAPHALDRDIARVITKPFDVATVTRALRDALDGRPA